MGLDMYLTANRYFCDFGDSNDNENSKSIGNLFPEIGSYRVREISTEIMYWRKANAIHGWFVKNVQEEVDECQKMYVNQQDLRNLLETCKAVLASPDQAKTLLPTQSGFFFGGTDYDEWYIDNLEKTVEVLEDIVPRMDTDLRQWAFYYQSSW